MDPFFDDFDRYFERRLRRMLNPTFWGVPSFSAIESLPGQSGQGSSSSSSSAALIPQPGQRTQPFVSASLDLVEGPDSYKVHVDMPGVKKEDIKVHVDGDVLTVEAERRETSEKSDEHYHYSERRFGRIKRQVALPSGADTKSAKAKFEDGLLELEFVKAPEASKRQSIDIQ